MKTFVLIWSGQLASVMGTYLTSFALGVWAIQKDGQATDYALILLCTMVPNILISPFAGPIVDRANRRQVMIAADSVAAAGTAVLCVLLLLGDLALWHILTITALSSVAGAFQHPAYSAAVAQLVPVGKLPRANGMIQAADGIGRLVSPVLAAVLLGVIGLVGVILIDLISFLIAVLTLWRVRIPDLEQTPTSPTGEGAAAILRRTREDLAAGFRFLLPRPGMLYLLGFSALSNFMTAAMIVLAAPLILSFSTVEVLGVLNLVCGLGVLAGTLFLTVWDGPKRMILLVLAAQILAGLAAAGAGLTTSIPVLGLAAFIFFVGNPITAAGIQTIWQRKVPHHLQGRVHAIRAMVTWSAMPIAYLSSGPLADYVFEPMLAEGGSLASSLGAVVGTGPGRGIGALLLMLGSLAAMLTAAAACSRTLRRLETDLPDANPETHQI